jgi:hypothetical protein
MGQSDGDTMIARRVLKASIAAVIGLAVVLGVVWWLYRPWALTWGRS